MKEKTVNCNNKMFDAFKVLRTNEEEVLRRLIDGDGINEQVVTSKDCDESVLRYGQQLSAFNSYEYIRDRLKFDFNVLCGKALLKAKKITDLVQILA